MGFWIHVAAQRHPDRVAIEGPDRSLTYAELQSEAVSFANRLGRLGARSRVGLALASPVEFAIALHGCMLAGVAAVLAPTVGPIVGGWITETWSWHWLFRINIVPGILAALGGVVMLRGPRTNQRSPRSFDPIALVALAVAVLLLLLRVRNGLAHFGVALVPWAALLQSRVDPVFVGVIFGVLSLASLAARCALARATDPLRLAQGAGENRWWKTPAGTCLAQVCSTSLPRSS